MTLGLLGMPRRRMPTPTAPLVTRMTRWPVRFREAIRSTRRESRLSARKPVRSSTMLDEPSLSTTIGRRGGGDGDGATPAVSVLVGSCGDADCDDGAAAFDDAACDAFRSSACPGAAAGAGGTSAIVLPVRAAMADDVSRFCQPAADKGTINLTQKELKTLIKPQKHVRSSSRRQSVPN